MQEENEKKEPGILKKIGWKNIIFLTLFGGMVIAVLGGVLYSYRNIPTAHWRMSGMSFPIKRAGVEITDIDAQWKNSAGNARLELRTSYYPVATITTGELSGSGIIIFNFLDNRKAQQGPMLAIRYRDGQLVKQDEVNMKVEGNTATILLEGGYKENSDYQLHRLREEEPLWRLQVWVRPDGHDATHYVGYTTIIPTAE